MRTIALWLLSFATALPAYGQDSLNITILGRIDTFAYTLDFERGKLVFTTFGDDSLISLVGVVDATEPTEPEMLSWIPTGGCYNARIANNTVFLATRTGISIYDMHNPADPDLIVNFYTGTDVTDLDIEGGYAYLALGIDESLKVVDISEFGNLQEVGSLLGIALYVSVIDNFAFVGTVFWGTRIISIADPRNPTEVSEVEGSGAKSLLLDTLLIVSDGSEGILFYDFTDPEAPEEILRYDLAAVDMQVDGDFLYVTSSSAGLRVLDISDLENIHAVGRYTFDQDNGDWLALGEDGIIYLAARTNGLAILQFTPPESVNEPDPNFQPLLLSLYSYPNPFNSSVTLSYRLDRRAPMSVRIYDTAGHEITSLFNGIATRGNHNLIWNAGNLPGGVYIGKLEAGDYVGSVRLVLTK